MWRHALRVQLHLLVGVGALAGPVPPFLLMAMHQQTLPSPSGCQQSCLHKPSLKCLRHHRYVKLCRKGAFAHLPQDGGLEGLVQAVAQQVEEGGGTEPGVSGHEPPTCSLQQRCLEVVPPRSPNLALWNDPRPLNLSSRFTPIYFIGRG